MFNLLFVILITTQTQAENTAYRYAMFDQVEGIEFDRIQEKWVKDVVKPVRFTQVLSHDEVVLLNRLTCQHYECRQAAMREIRGRECNTRMLIWGAFALDGQVKYVCDKLLEEKEQCDSCRGSRVCVVCDGGGGETLKTMGFQDCAKCDSGSCPRCGGLGDFKYVYGDGQEWGTVAWQKDLVLRKLFKRRKEREVEEH